MEFQGTSLLNWFFSFPNWRRWIRNEKCPAIVDRLIEAGAPVDKMGPLDSLYKSVRWVFSNTLVQENFNAIYSALVAHGAADASPRLLLAAFGGCGFAFDVWLKSPSIPDAATLTECFRTAYQPQMIDEVIKKLKDNGREKILHEVPLYRIAECAVSKLVKEGVDINKPDEEGRRPILNAMLLKINSYYCGNFQPIVDFYEKEGATPLTKEDIDLAYAYCNDRKMLSSWYAHSIKESLDSMYRFVKL